MGTDASQIQQTGLGSARPMLYFQDIPVFRNDFVSRYDAVHTQATTYVSAGSGVNTLVVGTAALGTLLAAGETVALMRGSDGILYRYPITAGFGTTTLTVTGTGSFFDPEQNKIVARVGANDAVFTNGQEVILAERADGSAVYCGCFGEFKGVVGFTSSNNAGLKLEYVGPRENENAYQYRMKWLTAA